MYIFLYINTICFPLYDPWKFIAVMHVITIITINIGHGLIAIPTIYNLHSPLYARCSDSRVRFESSLYPPTCNQRRLLELVLATLGADCALLTA